MIGSNTSECTTVNALGEEFPLAYNLNVAARLQETFGSQQAWIEKIYPKDGEPDLNALIETCKEFINEGIDIQNDTADKKRAFISKKLAGRILTEVGAEAFIVAMVESQSDSSKETEQDDEDIEDNSTPSND